MAIFKAPRITTTQRAALLLQESEIVFDTDLKTFYGGNGVDVGGFPIGQGVGNTVVNYTLTANDVSSKFIELDETPTTPGAVRLNIIGGIEQINGIDFQVTNNILSWDGLGLDNFIEPNDVLIVQY